jgi:hypothetical protein
MKLKRKDSVNGNKMRDFINFIKNRFRLLRLKLENLLLLLLKNWNNRKGPVMLRQKYRKHRVSQIDQVYSQVFERIRGKIWHCSGPQATSARSLGCTQDYYGALKPREAHFSPTSPTPLRQICSDLLYGKFKTRGARDICHLYNIFCVGKCAAEVSGSSASRVEILFRCSE